MKDQDIVIENRGDIVERTNYYDTPQAQRGEFYLTWNAGVGRLLVPDSMRDQVREMRCNNVVVTQKPDRIEIQFDDLSDYPYQITIAIEQSDRSIASGICEFSVYVRLGEKYRFPCKCLIQG